MKGGEGEQAPHEHESRLHHRSRDVKPHRIGIRRQIADRYVTGVGLQDGFKCGGGFECEVDVLRLVDLWWGS